MVPRPVLLLDAMRSCLVHGILCVNCYAHNIYYGGHGIDFCAKSTCNDGIANLSVNVCSDYKPRDHHGIAADITPVARDAP